MLKSAWLKILLLSLGVLVAALGAGWFLIGPDWRALVANPPAGRDVLFWSQGQRSATFRMMDQIPFIVSSNPIKAGSSVHALDASA